ncbi:MAG: glycine cleavage system aminomethyltransferase GcvT, partial [Acidimicrobiia bacterium]|nr:glycine cleavage system aminomethyltransferase GcvT [Acidimicrobiia bacterium]
MPESPLHSSHERLGARFTDFGGWNMPVQYSSVLDEHNAVRTAVGVFDVSHLGRFTYEGYGATEAIRNELCGDAGSIEPGRAQYTMALNQYGRVVDDIIVLRLDDDRWWILPNGVNYDRIIDRFDAAGAADITLERRREDTAFLAIQGPQAPALVESLFGTKIGRFRVAELDTSYGPLVVAGTGYTGERGVEVTVSADHAEALFEDVLSAGAVACGLGARDTLRLEKGYPLWGQDLDEDTSPLEAGLSWVVDWDHEFVGRKALLAQQERGLSKRMVAFTAEGRQIARHGYPMRAGSSVGTVAS